jgi:hypothetical protein
MRKIEVLNNKYEKVGLYKVLVNGKNYKDLFDAYGNAATEANLQTIATAESVELNLVKFWYEAYLYLSYGTQKPTLAYAPSGPSKYDVAYVNKTIDDPIAELNGHTLREVFEDGNDYYTIDRYVGENSTTLQNDIGGILKVQGTTFSVIRTIPYFALGSVENGYHYLRVKTHSNMQDTDGYRRMYQVQVSTTTGGYTGYFNSPNLHDRPLEDTYSTIFNLNGDITTKEIRVQVNQNLLEPLNEKTLTMYKQDFYFINLDILGISPTTNMDYYYSLYQARKNISKKVLTYTDVFELFNFTSTHLPIGYYSVDENNVTITGYDTRSWDTVATIIEPKVYYSFTNMGDLLPKLEVRNSLNVIYTGNEYIDMLYGIKYSGIVDTSISNGTVGFKIGSDLVGQYPYDYVISFIVKLSNFDELITKEQLDTMLAHYLLVKNIVIYPEIYVPTEPTGFGNRYAFLELNKKVYGHELDFENMNLSLIFGVHYNAYEGFNLLVNFLKKNQAVIAYDWGKGTRYTDVRLAQVPKTELESTQTLKSRVEFKRLTPFYEIMEHGIEAALVNDTELPIPVNIEITSITNDVFYIELENNITGDIDYYLRIDITALTIKPTTVYIDSENNKVYDNLGRNLYSYLTFGIGYSSFLVLDPNTEYVEYPVNATFTFKYKKWVMD